jgi:hypothetical protein
VNQYVAKGNDLSQIRNACGKGGVGLRQLVKGFADDLELPLHGGVDHLCFCVGFQIDSGNEIQDGVGGLTHVPEVGAGIMLQKRPHACG